MLRNPAGERNKEAILEVLKKYIIVNTNTTLLEISSGTGLHSSFLAKYFPMTTFQPSEYEKEMFKSIVEYKRHYGVENVFEPVYVDISKDLENWDAKFNGDYLRDCRESFDYMLNINMMHISPFECSIGLFSNSSKLLKKDGILFTYGPYAVDGVLTPESNISFDQSLKSRNPSWGIRDIAELKKIAIKFSIMLIASYDLPANNKLLVWKRN
ncbi:CLUMA_CG010761, isoform A [Clunio marinus]|uniref:CLUMA_CG010761, isoform A n=1 Tax=Clunio marinus TaxID=568069 RepID=A0A1J1IC91_9DIPT|nr:CLUMA_CG010761, isoform A [Clunio marinus]